MRWRELIGEKLVHASPLRARADSPIKKAAPLIPGATPPMDPGTAIASALPQIAQVVAGADQHAAQVAVAMDDEQEKQDALLAAQQYQQNTKKQS